MHACSQTHVVPCIRRAALHHRVSFRLQLAIARCEAGPSLNPLAVFGNAGNRARFSFAWLAVRDLSAGIMMFKPSTFLGLGYPASGILTAKYSALAGAKLMRQVGTAPWASSRGCWG
jgi:hypothetical protein